MADPIPDAPASAKAKTFRRRVFYIPGYDPIHPRRYRELYRKEGADQARISDYTLALQPKTTPGPFGWHVRSDTGEAEIEVLVWSDIVRTSMNQGIASTYLQLVRTAWAYIGSGALFRLMHLRKGPMIAALYPIGMLLAQALLAAAAAYGLYRLGALLHPALGLIAGLAVAVALLRAFRANDNRLYA